MSDPLGDVVARQYEDYPYPHPADPDLTQSWEWFDPSHASRLYWPERDPGPELDILVAGCGTEQAALFAARNPKAQVTGIDVSAAALEHERRLKDVHGLGNLTLHRLPVEEVEALYEDYDLIVATGVLHHLADPAAGLTALAGALRPGGALGAMVYGACGRHGLGLIESVFRDLGLGRDEESADRAYRLMAHVPADHPVFSATMMSRWPYLGAQANVARCRQSDGVWRTPDAHDRVWMVDTLLNGRQRAYTVPQLHDLVGQAGLVFQDWMVRAPYWPHELFMRNELADAVAARPWPVQWSIMERLNAVTGHCFIACRPERGGWAVDFSSPEAGSYVPAWRQGCGFSGAQITRPRFAMALDEGFREVAEGIDGVTAAAGLPAPDGVDVPGLLEALWRLDLISVATDGEAP